SGFKDPVLYRQVRVGEGNKRFDVLKFRSMRTDAEKNGAQWAQQQDNRITRVGSIIRKCRIDELPQIFNVIKGEMSFVGPRPERPEFVKGFDERIPYYRERHRVKPGITGWAQLCHPYGADELDTIQKLQYDLYYVKNYSIFLDLSIMLHTMEVVLWGKGAR
ncbi:MAG: sugar transferase, partial [Methylococcales bacterium]|nr:sugar transferase [Methylococcales bacterium]